MLKKCNNCGHSWTNVIWACPRCSSTDISYSEETMLPVGYKPPEYKYVPELDEWLKQTKKAVAKMPKDDK